jgi:predicted transcriptional regulator
MSEQVPKVQKRDHVLPEETVESMKTIISRLGTSGRNGYIKILRDMGWTLQSIANVIEKAESVSLSRERIRQICSLEVSEYDRSTILSFNPSLPELPLYPTKEARVVPVPSEESLKRLQELKPLAQLVRSSSPRYRKEAEEYAELIWKVHTEEGVSLYKIARCLDLTPAAVRFRMVRYGYISSKFGKSKSYQKIQDKNRYTKVV